MDYLPNGLILDIPDGCFPLSTDSMVLAHFIRLPKNAHVLDLGSGCATLGLLLCATDPGCHVTGVELDPASHEAAVKNIQSNALSARMESICTDLRHFAAQAAPGSFSACISNPPYFSGGGESRTLPDARQEISCTLPELMEAAGRLLKYGGDFFLVHKPERLAQIIALGAAHRMEAKRLLLLHHRQGSPVNLILMQLRKGGKPGLSIEEAFLFDSSGCPSQYYQAVYHMI